jgi:hypothetical protein
MVNIRFSLCRGLNGLNDLNGVNDLNGINDLNGVNGINGLSVICDCFTNRNMFITILWFNF